MTVIIGKIFGDTPAQRVTFRPSLNVPIGTFNEGEDVILWAGVSPVDFPTLTVTREQADGDQSSSGEKVLVGTIVRGG